MIQTLQSTRRHPRVRTRLKALYGVGAPDIAATAESVSIGGVFLNTGTPCKVGSRLVIQIDFHGQTVRLCGEVAWAMSAPEHQRETMICGMGIMFTDPDPSWREFFASWQAGLSS